MSRFRAESPGGGAPALRRRRAPRTIACLAVLACLASPRHAASQGSLYLRIPVSPRSVGAGEAAVADTLGVDAAWVNPAALAAMTDGGLALYGSTSVAASTAGVAMAVPSAALGTIGVSALQIDFGDQSVTDASGITVGTITNRAWLVMASYATTIGSRVRAGVSYKYTTQTFACSGLCGPTPAFGSSGGALDLGVQADLPMRVPVTVAVAVRHLGPDAQVKDSEQADPLPRTVQVGARVRVPWPLLDENGASLQVAADVVESVGQTSLGVRTGLMLDYRGVLALRGGWSRSDFQALAGPSIGASLRPVEQLTIDLARRFDGFSTQAGQQPTYFALRFRF